MLRSMTGFGVGRAAVGDEELSVELKSVNHKFIEVKVRLPRELASLEPLVLRLVKERLVRGAVEVFVRRVSTGSASLPVIDDALVAEYQRVFTRLAGALRVDPTVGLAQLISQPGVLRLEDRQLDLDAASRALTRAVSGALDGLVAMRDQEGLATRTDLAHRLDSIERLVQEIQALAPRSVEDYQARLTSRLADLLRGGTPVDPQRLAQEIALFAERTDVAEEMARLASHLTQFRALLGDSEPAGRRMDFLVQEMNREVNTTGSKSQSSQISTRIVALKAELERIREQVQNVE